VGYRGSLAAGEDADTEYGGGESAEAACSGAWSRGAALAQLGQSQNTGWTAGARPTGVQRDVASGAAGGFIGHQPVTSVSLSREVSGDTIGRLIGRGHNSGRLEAV
jgi:hypothetical protein